MFTELNLATREGYSHNLLKINRIQRRLWFSPFSNFQQKWSQRRANKVDQQEAAA